MRSLRLQTLLGTLLLTGCREEMSILRPGGPAAEKLAELTWIVLITFSVVTVAMWALIVWVGTRRRGSFEEHAPPDIGGGQNWILWGGFLIPAAVLAVIFVIGLQSMSTFPMKDGEIAAPEIAITGHQWWWEVKYVAGPPPLHVTTANEIHIPTGRYVDIQVTTADVIHSFWIPGLHGKTDLIPGRENRIRLRAEKPGIYRGQCAEFCGANHAKMILVLVAQPPDEYDAWLDHQREPAVPPVTTEAIRGKRLFVEGPCALCHTIRGTDARGGVGPDLTHLASRDRIASNYLENNRANLSAWVTHAQSLKPEVAMPNLTMFEGEELRALVTYLEQLE